MNGRAGWVDYILGPVFPASWRPLVVPPSPPDFDLPVEQQICYKGFFRTCVGSFLCPGEFSNILRPMMKDLRWAFVWVHSQIFLSQAPSSPSSFVPKPFRPQALPSSAPQVLSSSPFRSQTFRLQTLMSQRQLRMSRAWMVLVAVLSYLSLVRAQCPAPVTVTVTQTSVLVQYVPSVLVQTVQVNVPQTIQVTAPALSVTVYAPASSVTIVETLLVPSFVTMFVPTPSFVTFVPTASGNPSGASGSALPSGFNFSMVNISGIIEETVTKTVTAPGVTVLSIQRVAGGSARSIMSPPMASICLILLLAVATMGM